MVSGQRRHPALLFNDRRPGVGRATSCPQRRVILLLRVILRQSIRITCTHGNVHGTDHYCCCYSNRYNTLLACPAGTGCQKLWLLSPPGVDPLPEWPLRRAWCCGPDSFAQAILPALSLKNPTRHERPYFVVQNVGETLYIPEQWHHATLALGR